MKEGKEADKEKSVKINYLQKRERERRQKAGQNGNQEKTASKPRNGGYAPQENQPSRRSSLRNRITGIKNILSGFPEAWTQVSRQTNSMRGSRKEGSVGLGGGKCWGINATETNKNSERVGKNK